MKRRRDDLSYNDELSSQPEEGVLYSESNNSDNSRKINPQQKANAKIDPLSGKIQPVD